MILLISNSFIIGMEGERFPQIFFLNGSSSAGKTTLALELQHALQPQNYQIISYDEFREHDLTERVKKYNLVPSTYTFTTVHSLFEDIGKTIRNTQNTEQQTLLRKSWNAATIANIEAFYTHIHDAATRENKLIVDAVVMNEQLQKQVETLRIYRILTIFTHITPDKLKERVEKRNMASDPKEHRMLERVMRVYPSYYNQEGQPLYMHDIIVDTGILTPQQAAEYVIKVAQSQDLHSLYL